MIGEKIIFDRSTQEVAWVAGPYGDCHRCNGTPKRMRTVTCQSLDGGSVLPDDRCAEIAERPSQEHPCSCDDGPCKDGACEDPGFLEIADGPEKGTDAGHTAVKSGQSFRSIGCLAATSMEIEALAERNTEVNDETCLGWKGDSPCMWGLPFYRKKSNYMTPDLCYSFCTGKGLDLFGIVPGGDCRCGASALNQGVWHHRKPPPGLALPMGKLEKDTVDAACPVRVFRYTGHFDNGAVPFELTSATVGDEAYIDSLVAGRRIDPEAEEDTSRASSDAAARLATLKKAATLSKATAADVGGDGWNIGQPSWTRACWPSDCGPGGGPWQKRRNTLLAGISGRWQEYTIIEFFFAPEVDDVRRAAFRMAVDAWKSATCILFVEAADWPAPPALIVRNDEEEKDHCFTTHIGYPGDHMYSSINLGWCNDNRYVGNIIHELGHVLGMNHEQKRPDAVHSYHGHGPYLTVNWANVGQWADQYEQDPLSYTGSRADGEGDPFVGYAPYDFGSIMHYPTGTHFSTIPADRGVLTGNRRALSELDIMQILDEYQCKLRPGTTAVH